MAGLDFFHILDCCGGLTSALQNFRLLEAGIRATIDSSRYVGTVQLQFKTTPQTLSQYCQG